MNKSTSQIDFSIDYDFLLWLKLSKISPPQKDLFCQVTQIWHDYVFTLNNDRLIWFTNQLLIIKQENGNSIEFLPEILRFKASDCFVLLNQFDLALEFFPVPTIDSNAGLAVDRLMSLKYVTNNGITGNEILKLSGLKVTKYGKEHLEDIFMNINTMLEYLCGQTNIDLISDWVKDSDKQKYPVGLGDIAGYFLAKNVTLDMYRFSNNSRVIKFATDLTREAENISREQIGIPKVGEGWVSETQLYFEIKKAFPSLEVLQHAKPEWLGRQHLDIFIPEINMAFEYQGLQHEKPVDYFGGQESFEKNLQRDQKKSRLCRRHSIKLIYVYPFYDLGSIIEKIKEYISME